MAVEPEQRQQYSFGERVGRVVHALDRIRYEEGIDYLHRDMAETLAEFDDRFEELYDEFEENRERFDEHRDKYESVRSEYADLLEAGDVPVQVAGLLDGVEEVLSAEEERMADAADRMAAEAALHEEQQEVREYFEDIKYNGETESGPGALVVLVDGAAEAFAAYADGKKEGNKTAVEEETTWGPESRQPDLADPVDLAEDIYRTMEWNDGAIVAGEDEFLPKTYWIPDSDAEEYIDGGTKHKAAVDAVHNDAVPAETLVLSATDGAIRWIRRDGTIKKLSYDPDDREELEPVTAPYWDSAVEMPETAE